MFKDITHILLLNFSKKHKSIIHVDNFRTGYDLRLLNKIDSIDSEFYNALWLPKLNFDIDYFGPDDYF